MSKTTLAQKMETALQCHACGGVYYSLVAENGMRKEDKGPFDREQNKRDLVIKGEMWGSL